MIKNHGFLNTLRRCVYFSAVFIVVGCSSAPVATVPVFAPCLGPAPAAPEYLYGTGAYPGDIEAVKMLAADLVDAKQYSVELKAQMAGCK